MSPHSAVSRPQGQPDHIATLAEVPFESYIMGLRKLVGCRRLIVPGVRALILDDQQRILLQRRGDLEQDLWTLPSGSVELNDSAFGALKREVREETGLEILSAHPFAIYSGPQYNFTYPNGHKTQAFALSFLVERYQGELMIDGRETVGLAFVDPEDLPENLYEPHRENIADYLNYDGQFILK